MITLRALIVWFFFIISSTISYSQKKTVDSLEKAILAHQPDSVKANQLIGLALAYESVDTLKAIATYYKAFEFTKAKGLTYYEGKAYRYIAGYYTYKANHDLTLKYLCRSFYKLKTVKTAKGFKEMATLLTDFGDYFEGKNETAKALFFYHKSTKLGELIQAKALSRTYINLARLYQLNGSKDYHLKYLKKGLENATINKNYKYLFGVNYSLANYYVEFKNYKESKRYLDSCEKYINFDNSFASKHGYLLVKGLVAQETGELKGAKKAYIEALDLAKAYQYEFNYNQPELQLIYGEIMAGKLVGLENRLKQALYRANKYDQKKDKEEIYEYLADINYTQKRYKEAFDYYEKFHKTKDTLVGIEKTKLLGDLEIKYQTSKKDLEIQKKNQDLVNKSNDYKLVSLGLISVFTIALLGFLYYQKRLNFKNKELLNLRQAQQLTATESILKGQEEERGRLARDLHDGLGGLLSGIKLNLNNMNGNVILSEQNASGFQRAIGQLDEAIVEMRRVAHSMMPEALLKFGLVDAVKDFAANISQTGSLKVHFQTVGLSQERFPENVEITLYRIIQELINNAIKHANAADMYLQLAKTDSLLTLTAEDNGQGFDSNEVKEGIGLKNIRNRVDYLGGKLDIRSEVGKGSSFLIEIHV